ncbi:hypothetical protein FRC08_009591 [Ceratobasidium sp. 394]|nr:hypothetical protein FRC08_009591 [Ceratobasidium sp. 394]
MGIQTNVLVNDTGNVAKICDFGSSRIECPCHCELENQSGTGPWESPELFEGDARTAKSDIWAFGCLALEAQFGRVPYDANLLVAYKKMRRNQPPATQASVNLETPIPNSVWDTMQRCWEFDPTLRPSAQTILAEFEVLAESADLQPVVSSLQDVTITTD